MFHKTLNDALSTVLGLVEAFPVGVNVPYNHTVRGVSGGVFFSVYRDERGRYESAFSYESKMSDWVQVVAN